jgi:hypothetical protein
MSDLLTAPRALVNATTANERMEAIRTGLLLAVAYGDVFDYAMPIEDVRRYLVGRRTSKSEVGQLIREEVQESKRLSRQGEVVCLAGREELFAIRRKRQAIAQEHWPAARAYGRVLARLPFVRMVAVTGSLAMDNLEAGGDIDYLVVTAAGRLWLCRAMAILVVRRAALSGVRLCPNYFISQDSLESQPHDLYNAHELAQMVPLNNMELYARMRASNAWSGRYLPNAQKAPTRTLPDQPGRWVRPAQRLGEAGLAGWIGEGMESWEMRRKIARFSRRDRFLRRTLQGPF